MSADRASGAYTFAQIEAKWQDYWARHKTFKTLGPGDDGFDADKPKYYVLDMFPYPSGAGLHVGHPEGYTATDIVARYKRMKGFNVLHPMAWDSFGLPAEQYAIEHGVHPAVTTQQNIDNIRRQIKALGFSYDWDREFATSDVRYYKWTQWIFLQMFNAWYDDAEDRARPIAELVAELADGKRLVTPSGDVVLNPSPDGSNLDAITGGPVGLTNFNELSTEARQDVIDNQRLAYEAEVPVNWCPALGTVLANEEVTNEGLSDRGNHPVFRRPLRQWMLRITKYAERLMADLDTVDWPEPIRLMQRNWIGRSEGADVDFPLAQDAAAAARRAGLTDVIRIFTTRPDTLFGATYMVLAPEHALVDVITTPEQQSSVRDYCDQAARKSDLARTDLAKAKTGVFTGAYALNPVFPEDDPKARIPIWVADYVLMTYGTGAIMAVPAHDQRDYEFAEAFDLPITDVVYPRKVQAIRHFVDHCGKLPHVEQNWQEQLADLVLEVAANPDGDLIEQFDAMVKWTSDWLPSALPNDAAQARLSSLLGQSLTEEMITAVNKRKHDQVRDRWREAFAGALDRWQADSPETLRERVITGRFYKAFGAAYEGNGTAVNSGPFDGLPTAEFKNRMTEWLEEQGAGKSAVNYKLRDWIFSRQKYWGEPFPVLHDDQGNAFAVNDADLPVPLPEIDDYKPTPVADGSAALPEPPLGRAKDWVNVEIDGKRFRRNLNTMPQWAGSCWYFIRYVDALNAGQMVDPEKEAYWMPVDLYVGGAEHAVLHLLYSRFWHKFLYDIGAVSTPEPFAKLFNQGMIRSFAYRDQRGICVGYDQIDFREDGAYHKDTGEKLTESIEKMSKSLRNVINPDDQVAEYGADTFRLYEMYMGPLEATKPWNTRDVPGVHRFLHRVWRLVVDPDTGALASAVQDVTPDEEALRILHQTIKKVGQDIERLRFNTAIAQMIVFANEMTGREVRPKRVLAEFVKLLSPFSPHVAEELWQRLRGQEWTDSITYEAWPEYDPDLARDAEIEIAVQIGKKIRDRFVAPADMTDEEVQERALSHDAVKLAIAGKKIQTIRVVSSPKGKLINIVAT
ncbi:MAG: leucine--tRNA ligase [Phycisphaerae bacterium]|nr:leucine--tRNA ligase [Phycisphaerae bacterium]